MLPPLSLSVSLSFSLLHPSCSSCAQSWLSCSNSPAGTNRALLCKSTVDGLQVTQLNVDHTTENEDELFRLSQLGESGRGRPPWLTLSLLPGGRLGRGRKCLGCDLGLGTSLPGVGSQLCPLLAGDVRNFGSLCLSFPICVMRIVVTPASGPCED